MSRWTARRTVLANVARVVADIADAAAADELMDSSEPVTASDDVTDVCHTYDTGNNCSDTALCFEMSEHGEFSSGHSSTIDESNAGHDECAYTCNMSDAVPCDFHDMTFGDVTDSESDSDACSSDGIITVLRKWAVKYSIKRNALSELLTILRQKFPELPKDARTFLPTADNAEMGMMKSVSAGSYYHFGVENGIRSILESHDHDQWDCNGEVSVQINVDGLPLFKSTNGQFWPVLGKLELPFVSDPFVIGIFYSTNKPGSLDFLADFVGECKTLMQSGIVYKDHLLKFGIYAVVCDAPARSFIKNVKGHSSYSACERCRVAGVWNGKMTFPATNAPKRSDVAFDEMQDPDHHHGESPLLELGIGMVSQFVIDYMHLICLGVVRRLIWLWLSGPVNVQTRLRARCVTDISECLCGFSEFMPVEFARKPRALIHWQRWKATEFRQFLLYTGPVALLGKLSDAVYKNFMLLSVGMFLLLHKTFAANTEYVNYADELLHLFVQHFAELYGSNMLVYNVHNVVHLADDARKYGALDAVSAFAFENFLGKLTRLVRKPGKPLQQVIRRLWEDRQYGSVGESKSIRNGPAKQHHGTVDLPSGVGQCRQYKQLYVNGVLLSVQAGNNCITLGTQIVILKNIVVKNSETMLIYQKFRVVEDFFKYPLKSSDIGINFVSDLSSKLFIGTLSDYECKNVALPHNSGYVVFPLVH